MDLNFFKNKKDGKTAQTKEEKIANKAKAKEEKKEKKQKNEEENGKIKEKFSMAIRRRWLTDGLRTFLIIAILVTIYVGINLLAQNVDLPEIDVTENKVYTLTDASKEALANIADNVKIYVYGIEEDSYVITYLDQYCRVNDKISYEFLTDESNLELVNEYGLQSGVSALILKTEKSSKVIDAASDFVTTDNTTYETIDVTEQAITNAILDVQLVNKPTVYFVTGHEEYSVSSGISYLNVYLENESFNVQTINLLTVSEIPEDCRVLAIMSPKNDYLETEKNMIINYINQGGNLFITMDPVTSTTDLTNIQAILSEYGVSFQNGVIYEFDSTKRVSSSLYDVFLPTISTTSSITKEIASSGTVVLAASGRLQFADEETLTNLNVTKEDLLMSSEKSVFATDLTQNSAEYINSLTLESSVVASMVTKVIPTVDEIKIEDNAEISSEEAENVETATDIEVNENDEETEIIESKLIICANGRVASDATIQSLQISRPLLYLENNKDFVINSISELAEKVGLKIRKRAESYGTFVATSVQIIIVRIIVFAFPILIMATGVIVWVYRRKRK